MKSLGGELPKDEEIERMNQLQREAEEEALMSGKADLPLQQQMEFSDKDMEEETPGMTLLD